MSRTGVWILGLLGGAVTGQSSPINYIIFD